MNPIIDIVAKATNNEAQVQPTAPTKGDGQNPFTQVFAQAIAATNEPPATPVVAAQVPVVAIGESGADETNLATQLVAAIVDPALTGAVLPAVGETQVGASESSVAANTANVELVNALTGEATTGAPVAVSTETMATGSLVAQRQLSMQAVNIIDSNEAPTLSEQAQRIIEKELSEKTKQESAPVTISTQVEISNEALSAVAAQDTPKDINKPAVTDAANQIDARSTLPTAVSLKAQMRKSFATADIKSASAKATVQVKLSDAQSKNNMPMETRVVTPDNIKAVDLPIASARQIAMATVNPTLVRKPQRGGRLTVSNEKQESELSSRQVRGDKVATRTEPKTSIRKPVQMALKSQGFDLDKLAASTGRSEASTLQSTNIEKTDTMAALEKPAAVAIDKSLELNGIERFKLEIKRGHIEALLKKGEVKLQLQPEHLGNLKVKLITNPTNVSARLETSSEEARRAVEASLPQLRESFERAGLKLGSIEVIVNHDNDQQRQHAFQQNAHSRNGGGRRSLRELGQDIPVALAEIANTQHSAYGGALNLVA